ncbi:hypothetical protein, partial [Burkholderia gladioli]|uniref:hypothetical protein n=1 Tax=Burkholderia gladioli TaxID=28095 RepID=UPI001ABB2549
AHRSLHQVQKFVQDAIRSHAMQFGRRASARQAHSIKSHTIFFYFNVSETHSALSNKAFRRSSPDNRGAGR